MNRLHFLKTVILIEFERLQTAPVWDAFGSCFSGWFVQVSDLLMTAICIYSYKYHTFFAFQVERLHLQVAVAKFGCLCPVVLHPLLCLPFPPGCNTARVSFHNKGYIFIAKSQGLIV